MKRYLIGLFLVLLVTGCPSQPPATTELIVGDEGVPQSSGGGEYNPKYDVTKDGFVKMDDVALISQCRYQPISGYCIYCDVNDDGVVDVDDWNLVNEFIGNGMVVSNYEVSNSDINQWHYPRKDKVNSGFTPLKGNMNTSPEELWSFEVDKSIISTPVSGDLDNDGKLEVVFADMDGVVYVLNAEDGSLLWQDSSYVVTEYQNINLPQINDLDYDGDLDILNSVSNKLIAYDGKNGNVLWVQDVPRGDDFMGTTVDDLNNDGILELITSDYAEPRNLHLYEIVSGGPNFIWSREITGSIYARPATIDINRDGTKEIIFHAHDENQGDPAESLFVYNINGDRLVYYIILGTYGYTNAVAGDFDADGNIEIAAGNQLLYYFADINRVKWKIMVDFPRCIWGSHGSNQKLTVGDLDGDGDLETVISQFSIAKSERARYAHEFNRGTPLCNEDEIEYPGNKILVYDDGGYVYGDGLLYEFKGDSDFGRMSNTIIADVNNDGNNDILVGSETWELDPEGNPQNNKFPGSIFWDIKKPTLDGIFAIDGKSGEKIWKINIGNELYYPGFSRGMHMSFVDIDNDGFGEIIAVTTDINNKFYVKAYDEANGNAQVYLIDPISTPDLKLVQLKHLDRSGYLKGQYADVLNYCAGTNPDGCTEPGPRVYSEGNIFVFEPVEFGYPGYFGDTDETDQGHHFDETMAYYAATRAGGFFDNLGVFSGTPVEIRLYVPPIPGTPDDRLTLGWTGTDGNIYVPMQIKDRHNYMRSPGGIIHEYTHVVHHPFSWGPNLAVGEGYPVYFTCSILNTSRYNSRYDLDTFSENDIEHPVTFASALWDVRKELGQDITDRLIVQSWRLQTHRKYQDARQGLYFLLEADKKVHGGAHTAVIMEAFRNHGIECEACGATQETEAQALLLN